MITASKELRSGNRSGRGDLRALFLTDDGLLIGYLETDDYAAAQQRMAQTDVNARWQADMQPYFAGSWRAAARRGIPQGRRDLPPRLSAPRSAVWR
jgi:L-rhamnose mutarotase